MGRVIALSTAVIPPPAPLPTYVNPPYFHFAQNDSYDNLTNKDYPRAVAIRGLTDDFTDVATHQGDGTGTDGHNPTPIVALYKNLVNINQAVDPTLYTDCYNNKWFMLDVSNNPVVHGTNNPLIDVSQSQAGYAAAWVAYIKTNFLDAHHSINALWLDTIFADYRIVRGPSYTTAFGGYRNAGGPTAPGTHGTEFSSVTNYATDLVTLLRATISEIQKYRPAWQPNGYKVFANAHSGIFTNTGMPNGTFVVSTTAQAENAEAWWDMMVYDGAGSWRPGSPIFDGLTIENWLYTSTDDGTAAPHHGQVRRTGTSNSYDHWEHWTDTQLNCQARTVNLDATEGGGSRPLGFHGHCESWQLPPDSTDITRMLYSNCSFLLNWDGSTGQSMAMVEPMGSETLGGNSYASGYGTTIFLGEPRQSYGPSDAKFEISTTNSNTLSGSSHVWRRDFQHGYVIVNTTTSNLTYVGGDFTGSIPSGTAKIVAS